MARGSSCRGWRARGQDLRQQVAPHASLRAGGQAVQQHLGLLRHRHDALRLRRACEPADAVVRDERGRGDCGRADGHQGLGLEERDPNSVPVGNSQYGEETGANGQRHIWQCDGMATLMGFRDRRPVHVTGIEGEIFRPLFAPLAVRPGHYSPRGSRAAGTTFAGRDRHGDLRIGCNGLQVLRERNERIHRGRARSGDAHRSEPGVVSVRRAVWWSKVLRVPSGRKP